MAYNSTIEEKRIERKQPDVINAIKSFIQTNAKFPDSYKPIDFSNYSWGGTEDEKYYEIVHKYSIKQSDGKKVDVTNFFIINKDFKVMLIETTRSNTISADPPETDEWKNTYGQGIKK